VQLIWTIMKPQKYKIQRVKGADLTSIPLTSLIRIWLVNLVEYKWLVNGSGCRSQNLNFPNNEYFDLTTFRVFYIYIYSPCQIIKRCVFHKKKKLLIAVQTAKRKQNLLNADGIHKVQSKAKQVKSTSLLKLNIWAMKKKTNWIRYNFVYSKVWVEIYFVI
jgi:hypothetical protein